jgi:hypothetical protein
LAEDYVAALDSVHRDEVDAYVTFEPLPSSGPTRRGRMEIQRRR